jgi:uncharacterized membrane protein
MDFGAVIGTLGGHAFRARLAAAFRNDRLAALIEDAVAIAGALLAVRLQEFFNRLTAT